MDKKTSDPCGRDGKALPASPRDASRYFETFFDDLSTIPVAFAYEGVRHEGLGGLKVLARQVGHAAPGQRKVMDKPFDW